MKLIVHGTDGVPRGRSRPWIWPSTWRRTAARSSLSSPSHVVHSGGKGLSPPISEVEQPPRGRASRRGRSGDRERRRRRHEAVRRRPATGEGDHAARRGARRRPDRRRFAWVRRRPRRACRIGLPRRHDAVEDPRHRRDEPHRSRDRHGARSDVDGADDVLRADATSRATAGGFGQTPPPGGPEPASVGWSRTSDGSRQLRLASQPPAGSESALLDDQERRRGRGARRGPTPSRAARA